MKTAEEYRKERAEQMCSTYIQLYGRSKRHTLKANSTEEAERYRGMEPTITIIEEKYDG